MTNNGTGSGRAQWPGGNQWFPATLDDDVTTGVNDMKRLALMTAAILGLAACEPKTERVYQGAVPIQTGDAYDPAAVRVADGVYVAN